MTRPGERRIVASERQVERLALQGILAETRTSLARRLRERLAPALVVASPEETRLILAEVLREGAEKDPLLVASLRRGPAAWVSTTDAIDSAIGALRAAGTTSAALAVLARRPGGTGQRATTLGRALVTLDRSLAALGLVDGRAVGPRLAEAIALAPPELVLQVAGGVRLSTRDILGWDASDLAWWRALDGSLGRLGGGAVLELPAFDQPLDADRERDPLEVLADDVARRCDEAPRTYLLRAPLGDLRFAEPPPRIAELELRVAADARAQATAVVDAVAHALDRGVLVERVAVALPQIDEEVLGPLRSALHEAQIPFHDTRGPVPASAPIVAFALMAQRLASRGLRRREVAALLRSRYVDARALTEDRDPAGARRLLSDIARVLEETPSEAAEDAVSTLVEAVRNDPRPGADVRAAVLRRIAHQLVLVEKARTRAEHARAARRLWSALGLPGRAGFDARVTLARDDVPEGLARAELGALARDAHAWEVLVSTLDAYEAALQRTKLGGHASSAEVFRHELERALEAGAPPPGAGRVGALRLGRLAELAGEPLGCLVVVDANEGVLPTAPPREPLLTEELAQALREMDPRIAPPSLLVRSARELGALAVASAEAESIVVTYRTRGDDAASLAPSHLASWLARASIPTSRVSGLPLASRPLTARALRLARLALGIEEGSGADSVDLQRRATVERLREAWHGFSDLRTLTADEARLLGDLDLAPASREDLTARLGGSVDAPLAVTALERFARCPFQGYASHLLGAREALAAGETPDAREHGTLVHEALAAAFTATTKLWRERPRDAAAIRERALEATDGLLQRAQAAAPLRRIALDRVREDVERALEFSIADEAWDFVEAERAFGESRAVEDAPSWPALVVSEGDLQVALRGRIDRIDLHHQDRGAVRVVDYKTSKSSGVRSTYRELGTTALQIPLYARAASEATGRHEPHGLYLPLADLALGYAPPRGFDRAWADMFDPTVPALEGAGGPSRLTVRVADIVRRARAGQVAPRPIDKGTCPQCSYDGACRRPKFIVLVSEMEEET